MYEIRPRFASKRLRTRGERAAKARNGNYLRDRRSFRLPGTDFTKRNKLFVGRREFKCDSIVSRRHKVNRVRNWNRNRTFARVIRVVRFWTFVGNRIIRSFMCSHELCCSSGMEQSSKTWHFNDLHTPPPCVHAQSSTTCLLELEFPSEHRTHKSFTSSSAWKLESRLFNDCGNRRKKQHAFLRALRCD